MNIKNIKHLIEKYSIPILQQAIDELENKGTSSLYSEDSYLDKTSAAADIMSDLLQSIEVKKLVDNGMSVGDAVREFSKRIRVTLSHSDGLGR